MTTLLEQAVSKARRLSAEDQDALAKWILEKIEADAKWDAVVAKSPEKLAKLADKAWADHRAGKSMLLDPEKL